MFGQISGSSLQVHSIMVQTEIVFFKTERSGPDLLSKIFAANNGVVGKSKERKRELAAEPEPEERNTHSYKLA